MLPGAIWRGPMYWPQHEDTGLTLPEWHDGHMPLCPDCPPLSGSQTPGLPPPRPLSVPLGPGGACKSLHRCWLPACFVVCVCFSYFSFPCYSIGGEARGCHTLGCGIPGFTDWAVLPRTAPSDPGTALSGNAGWCWHQTQGLTQGGRHSWGWLARSPLFHILSALACTASSRSQHTERASIRHPPGDVSAYPCSLPYSLKNVAGARAPPASLGSL